MILKRLYDYAHDSADAMMPPGAEAIEIEYIIVIDKEGKFLRFESKRVDKKNVIKFVVKKRVGRTSKPKPNTLWDNGKYVFGFTEKDKAAHGLFVEKVREIAANNPEDESVRAWVKFYSRPGGELLEAFSEDPLFAEIQGNLAANFSARLEGDKEIIAEKQQLYLCGESEEEKGAVMGRCLVTGERGPLIRLATATPIPGCSPVASLVSCQTNSGYDSYGKTQAYNAPISQEADSYISAAVKKLSNKNSRNKVNIGARQFLFWGTGKSEADTLMEEGLSWFLGFQESKKDDPDAAGCGSSRPTTYGKVVPPMTYIPSMENRQTLKKGNERLARAKMDSVVARRALLGILQAKSREGVYTANSGRRIQVSRLSRLTTGSTKIFERREEVPAIDTAVSLLLDLSGSVGKADDMAIRAALALIYAMQSIPKTKAALTVFPGCIGQRGEACVTMIPFGSKPEKYAHGIGSLTSGGSTPLAETLVQTCVELSKRHEHRKIIIVVTDGCINENARTMLAKVAKSGMTLVGIGVGQHLASNFFSEAFPISAVIKDFSELQNALMNISKQVLLHNN